MARFNPKKFVFHEMFMNSNGKQSGSGFVGVIMALVAILSFITIMVGWWLSKPLVIEMSEKILQLALLSTALLGVRKVSNNKAPVVDSSDDSLNDQTNNADTLVKPK